jgi:polar amino acid transport system substrate-binding protein
MDGNVHKGINIETITEVCRRLNITPIFKQLPWKRALHNTQNGENEAIFSLFINEDRKKYFDYPSESINDVKMVLATNKDNPVVIKSITDLEGYRIGVYHGSSYGLEFDNADYFLKEPASTNESLVLKQSMGRTDFIVIDERVAKYWTKKLNLDNKLRILDFVVIDNPTYIAFSKKAKLSLLAERLAVELKKLKEERF